MADVQLAGVGLILAAAFAYLARSAWLTARGTGGGCGSGCGKCAPPVERVAVRGRVSLL